MLLDREKLLKKGQVKIEKVDFDDGDFVYVRQMSGRGKEHWERSILKEVRDENGTLKDYERNLEDLRAKLAVCTVCDEKGTLLLKPEDYAVLSQNMGVDRLEKIADKAAELNGIRPEDQKALVKNSAGGQAADSSSGSAKK